MLYHTSTLISSGFYIQFKKKILVPRHKEYNPGRLGTIIFFFKIQTSG